MTFSMYILYLTVFFLAALQNSIQDPDLLVPLGHGSKNGNGSSFNLITATSELFCRWYCIDFLVGIIVFIRNSFIDFFHNQVISYSVISNFTLVFRRNYLKKRIKFNKEKVLLNAYIVMTSFLGTYLFQSNNGRIKTFAPKLKLSILRVL